MVVAVVGEGMDQVSGSIVRKVGALAVVGVVKPVQRDRRAIAFCHVPEPAVPKEATGPVKSVSLTAKVMLWLYPSR
jgi:hypothetical protein